MKLVDTEIKRALDSGAWKAYRDGEPIGFGDLVCGPNSVDVGLGSELLLVSPKNACVDPKDNESVKVVPVPIDGYKSWNLMPGNLYLASVRESFDCSAPLWIDESVWLETGHGTDALLNMKRGHCFAPMIDGRSTLARVGLSVHNTAGFGDYGFDGQFTLEISCLLPIVLYPGMRIAQISFHELTGVPTQRYSGAYTKQTGPQPAVLGEGRI